jgi:hypothetical protein
MKTVVVVTMMMMLLMLTRHSHWDIASSFLIHFFTAI